MVNPRRRVGSSLLELLVVIGTIAILTGLLLAAVQRVRAAADRLRCQNNLRQVALALHGYHDVDGRMPPGTSPDLPTEPFPYLNWHARILPYLEQEPLWRVVESGRRTFGPGVGLARPGKDQVVPMFACPADTRTAVAWILPDRVPEFRIALTSYLGNAGTDYRRQSGVLYLASGTRLIHVTDGTSSTLLAGERPPSADLRFGWWYFGIGQGWTGSLDAVLGVRERNILGGPSPYALCAAGPYSFQPGRVDNLCSAFHFWSLHSGGTNFAFCDGSVRFLRYEADAILPALATRIGGEVVALD
jgi:prepilin-type processing-associated H-X9-DG protein